MAYNSQDIEGARRRVCIKRALRRAGIEVPREINEDENALAELATQHKVTPLVLTWERPRDSYSLASNTMGDAIALSSPSGRMSKRARKVAEKRLQSDLFGSDKKESKRLSPESLAALLADE